MKLPSSDPRSVHLDDVDCCALWHAVTCHSMLAACWGVFHGRFKLIQSVFMTSLSLSFVPSDETVAMYRSLVQAELRRLGRAPHNGLQCRHGREVHIKALRSMLQRLPQPMLN